MVDQLRTRYSKLVSYNDEMLVTTEFAGKLFSKRVATNYHRSVGFTLSECDVDGKSAVFFESRISLDEPVYCMRTELEELQFSTAKELIAATGTTGIVIRALEDFASNILAFSIVDLSDDSRGKSSLSLASKFAADIVKIVVDNRSLLITQITRSFDGYRWTYEISPTAQ